MNFRVSNARHIDSMSSRHNCKLEWKNCDNKHYKHKVMIHSQVVTQTDQKRTVHAIQLMNDSTISDCRFRQQLERRSLVLLPQLSKQNQNYLSSEHRGGRPGWLSISMTAVLNYNCILWNTQIEREYSSSIVTCTLGPRSSCFLIL
jgi:hypothetical protein